MFDLTGRKALVTGASGGIGDAIARALHAQGAIVGLPGTRVETLEALAAELGDRVHDVPGQPVRPRRGQGARRQKAEAELGGVDILVNNAGITRDSLFMRMKDEDWETVLDVNLDRRLPPDARAAHPMMTRRFGRIINITSIVGVTGNPGQANYCASKAGLIGMSKSLAAGGRHAQHHRELRRARLHRHGDDRRAEREAEGGHPGARSRRSGWAPARDIAAAVVYLATDEAAYVTGQTLHVNGGMAMI